MHPPTARAYVATAKDLRQRAVMWTYHLKRGDVSVKDWPQHPAGEWQFWFDIERTEQAVREQLAGMGWQFINPAKRTRVTHSVLYPDGTIHQGTLRAHCRALNRSYTAAYKRVERGQNVEQALGLEPAIWDAREMAIAQMRVKITTDDGEGLLTYDEALRLRPELGDLRKKIRRLRQKDPELVEIKLGAIPVEVTHG